MRDMGLGVMDLRNAETRATFSVSRAPRLLSHFTNCNARCCRRTQLSATLRREGGKHGKQDVGRSLDGQSGAAGRGGVALGFCGMAKGLRTVSAVRGEVTMRLRQECSFCL